MARKFYTGVDLQNQRAINLGNASASGDAVPYGQIQALLNGLDWKLHVRLAATTNINIASPGSSFDSVTAAVGDRILLPVQTTASQSNIYIYQGASTAMTLAPDAVQGELDAGDTVSISEGSTLGTKSYTLATKNPITVGTTSLTWAQNNASGASYSAGAGLTLNGTTFAVDTTVVARKYAANVGDGSSTSITVTHSLATLDVVVQLYLVSTGETVEADVVRATTNTVTLTFATAPASGALRVVVTG